MLKQTGMLMHDGNTPPMRLQGRMQLQRVSLHLAVASGIDIDTCEQLNAGALSGPVFAEQCQDLARSQVERNIVYGNCPSEGFADAAKSRDHLLVVRHMMVRVRLGCENLAFFLSGDSNHRRPTSSAHKRDNDEDQGNYQQHMSNPGCFSSDTTGTECFGHQGNNQEDDRVS